MSESVRLCAQAEVPEGEARCFAVPHHPPVALFNVGGTIYATADTCSHQRASIAEGEVDGDEVICPLHFQVFHIPTGEAREGVTTTPIATYPVSIEAGDIYVELS
jgi:nitrite reductase/ring-hydroxylating ferredoxin subunit